MFVFTVANSRDYGVRGEEGAREKIHEGVEEVFSGYSRSREMLVMVTALTTVVTGRRAAKSPEGGESGNKKTNGVRIAIPLQDILQTEGQSNDSAQNLNGSHSTQLACQKYGIHIWPPRKKKKLISRSFPNETLAVVDQDAILQLNFDRLSSDIQALVATVDKNSAIAKEIQPPQFLLTARQENTDEDFGDDEFAAVGIGGEGAGEGEMEEAQFNSGCLGKRKRKEKAPGGKRGNRKTTGVSIGITLEEILQTKGMLLYAAAKHLNVSRSTLKRACREYGIERWPPRKGHKFNSQSQPNESPVLLDHERIPHLNSDTLPPSNQVSATRNTNSVTVKARYGKETIKFWLSWPWGTVELKQQVKNRLELEDGTYFIRYKDEANEMILIACDDDLQFCISSSSPQGTSLIEVFLEPK